MKKGSTTGRRAAGRGYRLPFFAFFEVFLAMLV